MKVFIPALGTCLQLKSDWKFILQREYRNSTLFEALVGKYPWEGEDDNLVVTLPAGTILKVRRIYIRQGGVDYNSVTFSIRKSPDTRIEKKMFWAKLYAVNEIDADVVPTI